MFSWGHRSPKPFSGMLNRSNDVDELGSMRTDRRASAQTSQPGACRGHERLPVIVFVRADGLNKDSLVFVDARLNPPPRVPGLRPPR